MRRQSRIILVTTPIASVIAAQQRQLDTQIAEARHIASEGKKVAERVTELKAAIETYDEVIALISSISEQRQTDLQQKIETLVTHGLQTIFGQDITFHIIATTRGKLSATDFVVRSSSGDQTVETSILDARGGGLAAVAGFLLRLIVLLLMQDRAQPILFLDESFAQLSAEYEPRLADFIRELVDRTRVQIVLVTHSEAYSDAADVVYRFKEEGGVTQVVEV